MIQRNQVVTQYEVVNEIREIEYPERAGRFLMLDVIFHQVDRRVIDER
jgi:hypothetical protein